MPESFEVEAVIPAEPARVFAAWMDTKEHGAFTGAPALVEPWVGGRFTAHDGYLHGITLQLEPGKRIVQSWRSTEFPPGSPDSRIYVDLEPAAGGTRLRIKHVDVPLGQSRLYKPGWEKSYFKSMVKYFVAKPSRGGKGKAAAPASEAKPAPKPAAAARPAPAPKPAAARPPEKRPVAKRPSAARRAKATRPAAKAKRPAPKRAASKSARARPAAKAKKATRKGRR